MKTRLVFQDGKSNKFWEIRVTDTSHEVTYGRIGSKGQTKAKDFDSADDAKKSANKLIQSKKNKGYVVDGQASSGAKKAAKSATKSAAAKSTKKSAAANPSKKTAMQTSASNANTSPNDTSLALMVENKVSGKKQRVRAPTTALSVIALLLNYKNLFKKDYDETDFYQVIAAWLPPDLRVELARSKLAAVKKLLSIDVGQNDKVTTFSESMLAPAHVFWLPSKLPNHKLVKKTIEDAGASVTGTLSKKVTHAVFQPDRKFRDGIVLFDPGKLIRYAKQSDAIEESPYDDSQTEKIATLLLSENLESIDLGLSLLKKLDVQDKSLLVPLAMATYRKKVFESKFPAGTSTLLKKACEFHLEPEAGTNVVRKVTNPTDYFEIIDIFFRNDLDAAPLIHALINFYGKQWQDPEPGLIYLIKSQAHFQIIDHDHLVIRGPRWMEAIAQYPKKLATVEMASLHGGPYSAEQLQDILSLCPKVQDLNIENCTITPQLLGSLKHLREMSLGENVVFKGNFGKLKTKLKELHVFPGASDSETFTQCLLDAAKIQSITRLFIHGVDPKQRKTIAAEINKSLRKWPQLEELKLSYPSYTQSAKLDCATLLEKTSFSRLTLDSLDVEMKKAVDHKLEELEFSPTRLEANSLQHLGPLKRLIITYPDKWALKKSDKLNVKSLYLTGVKNPLDALVNFEGLERFDFLVNAHGPAIPKNDETHTIKKLGAQLGKEFQGDLTRIEGVRELRILYPWDKPDLGAIPYKQWSLKKILFVDLQKKETKCDFKPPPNKTQLQKALKAYLKTLED